MSEIKHYLYFDQPYIDSACVQAGVDTIDKKVIKMQEDSSNNDTSASFSLKQLIQFGFSNKQDRKNGITTEKIYTISNEHKIEQLQTYVSSANRCQYFTNLMDAIHKVTPANTTFINIHEPFYGPFYRSNPHSMNSMTEDDFIEFEYGEPPYTIMKFCTQNDPQDTYKYINSRQGLLPRIILTMNLAKFAFEHADSYLSNLVLHSEGIINLGVFGCLIPLRNMIYLISPLAVWI